MVDEKNDAMIVTGGEPIATIIVEGAGNVTVLKKTHEGQKKQDS